MSPELLMYDPASAALLDAAQVTTGGEWTKTLSYDAYGNALGFDPATAITEMLYNGESFNARTGQQYLRARWYSPGSGRFGQLDPFEGVIYLPATLNKYVYCSANPIRCSDPSGELLSFRSFLTHFAVAPHGTRAMAFFAGFVIGAAIGEYAALRHNLAFGATVGGVSVAATTVGVGMSYLAYNKVILASLRGVAWKPTWFVSGFTAGYPVGWLMGRPRYRH